MLKAVTLVGKNGSGKSEAAKTIAEHFGITYVSTSDLIQYSSSLDLPREDLIKKGKEIISAHKYGFAGFVLDRLHLGGRYVVDRMIESPDIDYLKQQGSFILVTTLDDDLRFQRMRASKRAKDGFSGNYEYDRKRMMEMDALDATDLNYALNISNYNLDTTFKRVHDDKVLMRKLTEYFSN